MKRKHRTNPVNLAPEERRYAISLRKIAAHVAEIIRAFPPADPAVLPDITRALTGYADVIEGWALGQAGRMVRGVMRADEQAWRERAVDMSIALKRELAETPLGATVQEIMRRQVGLIKSIPLDAAQRVHKFTEQALADSSRSKEAIEAIMESGQVSKAKATLIARTETGRTSSTLTQARAERVGSEGYIWRTSKDGDVRHSHAEMEGKFVKWIAPPTLDGMTGHAGCIPNCRCWCEVVLPD